MIVSNELRHHNVSVRLADVTILGNRRGNILRGKIFSSPPRGDRLGYFGYIPKTVSTELPPLVSIHGISRNACEHIFQFRDAAEDYGTPVIAPLFTRNDHRRFQRLAAGAAGVRADAAFDLTLREVAETCGVSFDKIRIFGHSAGGQFAHRYLMAHPERADRLSIFAPGWYSLPTTDYNFPYGVGGKRSPIKSLDRFFDISTQVLVGERDRFRDSSLRKSKKLDLMQGVDRVERANTWVSAMQARAREMTKPNRVELIVIPDAGHSFGENCRKHRLKELVMEHLYGVPKVDKRNNTGDHNDQENN